MTDERRDQRTNGADSTMAAAKTGKAVANIAKGAATGGIHGAALATSKHTKVWIAVLVAALCIPLVLVSMLPSVIFGSFFGDGSGTPNAITDDVALTDNLYALNTSISLVLSEGLTETLNQIDANFANSGCDRKVINNPYGADVTFNANAIASMYCASMNLDIDQISIPDLEQSIRAHKSALYSFTYHDESSQVETEEVNEQTGEPITETITTRVYDIAYNGEAHFADHVFMLDDNQKLLSSSYAQNLSVLLGNGMYQVLSGTDFSSLGASYEGIVFTDGATQVTYYNQLDSRWCNAAYGTDNIGGYACGPTAMAIVVSSLTSDTVDPPHMAQWAYENGYWCSGSGSYHTLIPDAAKEWGLSVEGCTAAEPQRLVDALADGKLIVALMNKGHFTSSGHFIVLRGVTSDGEILVADPSSYTRSERTWDMKIILNEASKRAGAGGPFWIIG